MTRTEEEIGAELAAIWAAVSKMASSLMWRTGREIDVPVPQVMEEPARKQETVEGVGEMPEIIVVSDAVEGTYPRERVQQRSAEKIEDFPQYPEETVEMLKLVSQENNGAPRQLRLCLNRQKRPSRWAGWSCMNQCNSALPNRLRMRLNLPQKPLRR